MEYELILKIHYTGMFTLLCLVIWAAISREVNEPEWLEAMFGLCLIMSLIVTIGGVIVRIWM